MGLGIVSRKGAAPFLAGCARASNMDCTGGLSCITTFKDGYCGHQSCKVIANDDKDSTCVIASDGKNCCLKTYQAPSACSSFFVATASTPPAPTTPCLR